MRIEPTIINTFKFKSVGWLIWLFAFFPALLLGQIYDFDREAGLPIVQNFDPTIYNGGSQNWSILQDLRGIMYIGNLHGVLEYDGVNWRMVPGGNGKIARSLAMDENGKIYVAAIRDFGFLAPDSIGFMRYYSLGDSVPEQFRDYDDVWFAHTIGADVFFMTYKYLFRWSEEKLRVWEPPIDRFYRMHTFQDTLYVHCGKDVGFVKLVGDSLHLIPDSEIGSYSGFMLPLGDGAILGTTANTMFWSDGTEFRPFEVSAGDFFDDNMLYHGAMVVKDTAYALATLDRGVGIINDKGELKQVLNSSSGVLDNMAWSVNSDNQGGLWIGLDNGLSRVEMPSPISYYDSQLGLDGTVSYCLRFQGRLYLATSTGVYVLIPSEAPGSPPTFKEVEGLGAQCWEMIEANGSMVVATYDGIDEIIGDKARKIHHVNANCILQYKTDERLIFVGTEFGIEVLSYQNNRWQYGGKMPGTNEMVNSISEDADGSLWLGSQGKGFRRIQFSKPYNPFAPDPSGIEIAVYDTSHGLGNNDAYTFQLEGKSLFATIKGLFYFDNASKKFLPETGWGKSLTDTSITVVTMDTDVNGRAWIVIRQQEKIRAGYFHPAENDDVVWLKEFATELKDMGEVHEILPEVSRENPEVGHLWFGGNSGLIRYDLSVPNKGDGPFSALIRQVSINADSAIFGGSYPENFPQIELAYNAGTIRFEYAALAFNRPEGNQYQVFLEGFEAGWSEWTPENYRDYTNLSEGNYRFRVRAQNIYGTPSSEDSFYFLILPPWYRSIWAYLGYIIIFVGLLAGVARGYNNYRSKEQARELDRQRELLEKERQVSERLREVDKLKDEFLANTSHELRTPLNGIIGLTESLIDGAAGKPSEKMTDNLSMIVASGKRLSSLVNDILDFSKLKTHELKIAPKSVDLRIIANLVLKFSEHLINSEKVVLKNDIPKDLPPVYADENRIQQILHNLLGNAIKFTREGTITIAAEKSGETVIVSVSDTGIGIPAEKLETIFQSFEQADASDAREFGGTGLGLSITRQLVELHKGTISVTSEPDKGSVFQFTLPIASTPASTELPTTDLAISRVDAPARSAPERSEMIGMEYTFNILVVDDEPINQQVLANHLEMVNYRVIQAIDGIQALQLLESSVRFDLVLLDIMMPRMSGYEVCQKIRQRFLPNELPIIMITAKNQVADLVEGFLSGANDYLAKPFSRDELLARIKTHLNLYNINNAYGRFVPQEFLHALGRESIIDVNLGDQVRQEMTVLFSDIRAYSTLSESMTPQENFNFLNAYYRRVGPVISANGGFVNQFYGDGIMALFNENADKAVQAALAIQRAVKKYNGVRLVKGRIPIHIGVGLNTGPMMLGIIGDPERMNAGVVSDAVNTAARMEGLTKFYGAAVIISEFTVERLKQPESFSIRQLGIVQVKGKKKAVAVYEVIDRLADDLSRIKIALKEKFESGLQKYLNKNFNEAIRIFTEIKRENPEDNAARIYLARSEKYLEKGVPADWHGVESVESK